eukprot:Nitzschia sp. Nitz4//scaffold3_size479765//363568//365577//NITZ4_000151-RA/size479765-processed-gene-1.254-mRNA-1//1//CDS//3329550911//5775//frame0
MAMKKVRLEDFEDAQPPMCGQAIINLIRPSRTPKSKRNVHPFEVPLDEYRSATSSDNSFDEWALGPETALLPPSTDNYRPRRQKKQWFGLRKSETRTGDEEIKPLSSSASSSFIMHSVTDNEEVFASPDSVEFSTIDLNRLKEQRLNGLARKNKLSGRRKFQPELASVTEGPQDSNGGGEDKENGESSGVDPSNLILQLHKEKEAFRKETMQLREEMEEIRLQLESFKQTLSCQKSETHQIPSHEVVEDRAVVFSNPTTESSVPEAPQTCASPAAQRRMARQHLASLHWSSDGAPKSGYQTTQSVPTETEAQNSYWKMEWKYDADKHKYGSSSFEAHEEIGVKKTEEPQPSEIVPTHPPTLNSRTPTETLPKLSVDTGYEEDLICVKRLLDKYHARERSASSVLEGLEFADDTPEEQSCVRIENMPEVDRAYNTRRARLERLRAKYESGSGDADEEEDAPAPSKPNTTSEKVTSTGVEGNTDHKNPTSEENVDIPNPPKKSISGVQHGRNNGDCRVGSVLVDFQDGVPGMSQRSAHSVPCEKRQDDSIRSQRSAISHQHDPSSMYRASVDDDRDSHDFPLPHRYHTEWKPQPGVGPRVYYRSEGSGRNERTIGGESSDEKIGYARPDSPREDFSGRSNRTNSHSGRSNHISILPSSDTLDEGGSAYFKE